MTWMAVMVLLPQMALYWMIQWNKWIEIRINKHEDTGEKDECGGKDRNQLAKEWLAHEIIDTELWLVDSDNRYLQFSTMGTLLDRWNQIQSTSQELLLMSRNTNSLPFYKWYPLDRGPARHRSHADDHLTYSKIIQDHDGEGHCIKGRR